MKIEELNSLNSYLSFRLNDDVFAINVASVLSILEMPKITRIPKAPVYIKGMINLRGEVLPVIDIHYKFGMPESEYTTNTCILVMEATIEGRYVKFGVLVDAVNEVHEIEPNNILPPPTIGSKYKSEFLEGVYKSGDSFIMIVEIANVLIYGEVEILTNSSAVTNIEMDNQESNT